MRNWPKAAFGGRIGFVAQIGCEGIHIVNPAWYLKLMSRPTPPTYKTRNWQASSQALKSRGSLTVWFDPEMIWEAAQTGIKGAVDA